MPRVPDLIHLAEPMARHTRGGNNPSPSQLLMRYMLSKFMSLTLNKLQPYIGQGLTSNPCHSTPYYCTNVLCTNYCVLRTP